MSDFWRNSIIRLRCFNRNSVINVNLKWAWTLNNNMSITFAFITLNCGANFGKVSFSTLVFSVTFNAFVFGVSLCFDV